MIITDDQLLKIQDTIRRGTSIVAIDAQTGDQDIYTFDGFSSIECPHTFCGIHPQNPGKKTEKACQGFMRWINASGKETENCPYIGGMEMTVKSGILIKNILRITKDSEGIEEKQYIKPSEY